MSKRLSDQDIEKAVRLLDAWTGKLTWERYLAVLATELGQTTPRQGCASSRGSSTRGR